MTSSTFTLLLAVSSGPYAVLFACLLVHRKACGRTQQCYARPVAQTAASSPRLVGFGFRQHKHDAPSV